MKKILSNPSRAPKTSRRAFCRRASLAALGLWSVPDLLTGGGEGSRSFVLPEPGSGRKEDAMEKRIKAVTAKVISVKGECGIHKAGDACTFTMEGVQGKVCIHAMYSMLPKVFAMMYGAKFPWLQNPDVSTHACPDAINPVVFEITRIYES